MERLIVVLTAGQLTSKRNCCVSRSENRYFVHWNTNQKIVWVICFVSRKNREDTKEFHYDALGHLV
jgi:hypothetical protein